MPAKSSIAIPPKRRPSRTAKVKDEISDTLMFAPSSPLRQPPRPTLAQPSHRFSVGERLNLSAGLRTTVRVNAVCTVVSLLPYEGRGSLQYRIRSDAEQFERIVTESDLTPS